MYTVGQIVNYTNGHPAVYTGTIMKVLYNGQQLVIIDHTDAAAIELWNACYSIGDCIAPSQILD